LDEGLYSFLKIFLMKKILLALLFFGFALQSQSQKIAPVKWAYQAVKTGDKKYNVIITANVDAPWHIYSQFVKKGPVPTTVQFAKNPLVVINGSTKEVGNLEKKFDNNFGAVIGSFGGKVQFIQAVTLKVNTKTKLTGTIEYMVCNEERCLPPTKQSFEVDIQ
jgi:thiol:disulfide interchange protein DsbD